MDKQLKKIVNHISHLEYEYIDFVDYTHNYVIRGTSCPPYFIILWR